MQLPSLFWPMLLPIVPFSILAYWIGRKGIPFFSMWLITMLPGMVLAFVGVVITISDKITGLYVAEIGSWFMIAMFPGMIATKKYHDDRMTIQYISAQFALMAFFAKLRRRFAPPSEDEEEK